jgi:hypothetical protein
VCVYGRRCCVAGQREEVKPGVRYVSSGREGFYGDFVDLSSGLG